MKYIKDNKQYVIRLDKGEEIVEKLTEFLKSENISTGNFTETGSVLSAEIGFYNLEEKEYHFKQFPEPLEIVSLTGNVALVDENPFVHAHTVLSNKNFECFGGHLKSAIIGATCEIYLKIFDAKVERKMDDEIGLKLLDL